jgi:hypothetical protein
VAAAVRKSQFVDSHSQFVTDDYVAAAQSAGIYQVDRLAELSKAWCSDRRTRLTEA